MRSGDLPFRAAGFATCRGGLTGAAPGRLSRPLLWATLAFGLTLHFGLLAAGFERLSSDEAARVLMSLALTPENAFEPWIWPPPHRWVLGLALKLHEDPVWVPRLSPSWRRSGCWRPSCSSPPGCRAMRGSCWRRRRWRWWRGQGGLHFGTLAAAGVVLASFPLFWTADSWIWYVSLENLFITPEEFKAIAGDDAGRQALLLNPLGKPLWQDLAWNPATWPGAAMLARLARRDAALRAFAYGFMTALPMMGASMLATAAASLAATWRVIRIWSLLLLPFGALALVRLAGWAAARLRLPGGTALAGLLLTTVALLAVRDLRLVRAEMFNWETGTWRHDT